jgi:ABC-type branched-subunit amino acid transport system ATPase component
LPVTTQYDKNCASPVLEARGVVKRFGSFTALGGVDLLIRPGEITALAGPNGAGKTTLFHILNGNLRPDKGRVILNGSDVTGLAPWKMARRGVGRLFQDVRVFPNLSASENIVAALMASGRRRDAAEHWLDLAGLKGKGAVKAERLSFVERKLLAISRLMALDARLLLLDEPAAALPPSETERVYSFVRRLVEERRVSVALVEHNIEAIRRFADAVCFLHEGECLKMGSAAEVFSDARVRALYDKDADSEAGQGKVEFVETCDAVRDARGEVPPDVAYLRDEGNVFPSLTVDDNLALAGWTARRDAAAERRGRAVALFRFLAERGRQRAGTLSGGQRQALAIAMTMCREARVYFFDEPSAGLAPRTAAAMFSAIGRFAADNPDCRVLVKERKSK